MSHNILLHQTPFHLSDIWVSVNVDVVSDLQTDTEGLSDFIQA